MDFNATIDLIIKDLKEASDIIDDLKKYPGVPVLQVELAKMKCKSAGEVISILKNNESAAPVRKMVQVIEKIEEKSEKQEEKTPVVPELITPVQQSKKTKVIRADTGTQQSIKPEVPKKTVPKEDVSSIIADQFVQSSGSLIEQISPLKTEEEIADILKTKAITSLNEAIGINDKFLYIREIFNGDQNEYNKALARLESVPSLSDAKAILMSYKGDNADNEAVNMMLDLVKRKLQTDE